MPIQFAGKASQPVRPGKAPGFAGRLLLSYVSLEQRIPHEHNLRKLRLLVDAVLGSMDILGWTTNSPHQCLHTLIDCVGDIETPVPAVRAGVGAAARGALGRGQYAMCGMRSGWRSGCGWRRGFGWGPASRFEPGRLAGRHDRRGVRIPVRNV